ncbi:MAG: hypothetical protein KDB27_25475 [Planctomycetales bacterium]|nr:hypothetical protein [Planctomycetales bacterium]
MMRFTQSATSGPFILIAVLFMILPRIAAQEVTTDEKFQMHRGVARQEVIQRTLNPYSGEHASGIDTSTLTGTVMCGYQGWFACPDDGSGRGWYHWRKGRRFEPGACTIDLWPDVSELDEDERFATSFVLKDGSPAEVFSSLNPKTVDRHFRWMKEYGIDGAFVQRFGAEVHDTMGLYHFNTVLANARAGANRHGRAWAVMYDLSGLGNGQTQVVIDDWKMLVDHIAVGRDANDKAYLRHNGKPVVAVWGIGFNDGRRYTLDECAQLVDFLANDPNYGGNTVMIGVPTFWRTLTRDTVGDAKLHEIVKAAHIVSPWMVGRYGTVDDVERFARDVWGPDLAWCSENGKEYLPVVFPGFSWHNMNRRSPLGQIPRQGGRFLWKQYNELRKVGATMVYQAMFDEVDEATAIFKCTNNPPVGESNFLDYEGLPTDHYLWLTGQGRRLIRNELQPTEVLPQRIEQP